MSKNDYITKYPKLILFLVVFVLYGNTIKNGYAIDDNCVTGEDCITAKGIKAIPKIFKSFYTDKSAKNTFQYRPLVKVSFAIEHQIFGVKASVSHFFNLIFYFLALLVLFKWLKIVFHSQTELFSFLIVILFAILPIHTEVVANIKNRDILLCFSFSLLASMQFFKVISSEKSRLVPLMLCVLFFYLAFLCKTDVIPFLAIVPVISIVQFKPKVKWLFGFIGLFILSILIFRITRRVGLESMHSVRTLVYFENPLFFEHDFMYRIFGLFNCLGFYVPQCIFPLKQSCYYGLDTIPVTSFSVFYGTLGLVFACLILYGIVWSLKAKEYGIFIGLFIFSAAISMYLNLVFPAVGIVADRFCFTASLGLTIAAITSYRKWYDPKLNFSGTIKGIAVLIVAVFGVITVQRNTEWKDINSLVDADVKKYPESVFLNYMQGANIMKVMQARNNAQLRPENQKQVADARANFEKAIAVYPDYPEALNYLSYVLIYMYNDFKTAMPHINKSLSLEYSNELMYYKGICFRELHQPDSSEAALRKCIDNDVNYQNAYDLLVYDYNSSKQYDKSITLLQTAIDKGNNSEKIRQMLQQAKLFSGEVSEIKK